MQPTAMADLALDEGCKYLVYDDENGRAIGKGTLVVGFPTIGIGRELSTHGISPAEAQYLFGNDIADVEKALFDLPWWATLDVVRKDVVTNLAFNMGINGVLGFHLMIAGIKAGNFKTASAELLSSDWANEVQPERRDRLVQQMRTGTVITATI